MRTLKAGAVYFALVFAAGFLLGTIRVFWVVPLVGVRSAELIESPIMLAVTVLAARRVDRKGLAHPLLVGLIALGLLLGAEFTTLKIRGLTLRGYFEARDPVSGTVFLILLAAFAVMPLLVSRTRSENSMSEPSLLDPFIPCPDVRERHQFIIHAPASLVMEVARNLDIQSVTIVRAIFWLRGKLLRAQTVARRPQPFIAEMLALGWQPLAESDGEYFIAGAACRPWLADVKFTPIPPDQFAAFAAPDLVKIAWSLEATPLDASCTRFATETRAVATDDAARAKFRGYWRKFRVGIVIIRRVLLAAVRREAESPRQPRTLGR